MFTCLRPGVRITVTRRFPHRDVTVLINRVPTSRHASLCGRLGRSRHSTLLPTLTRTRHRSVHELSTCRRHATNTLVASSCTALTTRVAIARTLTTLQLRTPSTRAVCRACMVSSRHGLSKMISLQTLVLTTPRRLVGSVVLDAIISYGIGSSRRSITGIITHCSLVTLPVASSRNTLINVIARSSTVSITDSRTASSFRGSNNIAAVINELGSIDVGILCHGHMF